MTTNPNDPYATPTDAEWAAIEERSRRRNVSGAANDEYFAAFEPWKKAMEFWQAELHEWQRMSVLRKPVPDYVIEQLDPAYGLIWKRPPTAKKIDPYHRPADVQQVLDDLIAEGKVRQIGKGYEWIREVSE